MLAYTSSKLHQPTMALLGSIMSVRLALAQYWWCREPGAYTRSL